MATRAKKSTGGRGQSRGKAAGARGRVRARAAGAARGRAGAARGKSGGRRTTGGRGTTGTRGRARGGSRTGTPGASREQDALTLLKREHDEVSRLFDEFERAAHSRGGGNGSSRKAQLATEICRQLQAHTALEEEIFYPAAAAAIQDHELIPEATVEHQSAKELVAKIEHMDPEDELYDASVMVLGEYVRHHVKEEQNELFPLVRRSGLDLAGLGRQMREWRMRDTM